MNIIDIIVKKKNKEELSKEEIEYAINGYLEGSIKDYQMSSLLMAIVLDGMNLEETYYLTKTPCGHTMKHIMMVNSNPYLKDSPKLKKKLSMNITIIKNRNKY